MSLNYQLNNKNWSINTYNTVLDVLDKNVDSKYYLSHKMKINILSKGTKGYICNPKINMVIARPLIATMGKMHRANVDNYYSDDFIQQKLKNTDVINKNIRRLTPKEALKLQGFKDFIYDKAKGIGVSDTQLYRQAGNAISINVVYAILDYMFKILNTKG